LSFIKSLQGFSDFLKLKNKSKKKTIFFFSELKAYRNHFEDIINKLQKINNYRILYFTSDYTDNEIFNSGIKPIYIGEGIIRIIFFTILSCDMMIMTLTDLGNHEIKKSKNCKNYLYIFHSMCSTFKSYTKKAFNNYDIIFANGDHQIKEIRKAENIYNLNKKKIYNIGYPYLENLKKKIKLTLSNNSILFAPSWSKGSEDLLEKHGIKIIEQMIKKNRIILRPHPQSFIKSKKIIKQIFETFKNDKNFELNRDMNNFDHFDKSSLLLTDNGGVGMEYYILYKRPVIYLNYKEKIHNPEYEKINSISLEENFKNLFGKNLDIDSITNLNKIIEETKENFVLDELELNKFLKGNNIEFKNTSIKACNIINEILDKN